MILGDAIVCWRACVVWGNKRTVCGICGVFLLATLGEFLMLSPPLDAGVSRRRSLGLYPSQVLGLVDSVRGCRPIGDQFDPLDISDFINPVGTMFEGLPIGVAACALSLSTNVLATLLIGYKAWYVSISERDPRYG